MMSKRSQGVVIGRDYPPPFVDHDQARRVMLELFGVRGTRDSRLERSELRRITNQE